MKGLRTSIIIPNFNGEELLKNNLPAVLLTKPSEVIVVDDGSSDGSLKVLETFRGIKVLKHSHNLGFVRAVNYGVGQAEGDVVILLNNDVKPEQYFLDPLVEHFHDENVFAVSCAEGGYSWAWAKFKDGFVLHGQGANTTSAHVSFWASGGSAAFSKEKWLKLGGMDELYKPFYWEDIDISYRAQKRGWKVIWEPRSKVVHSHESTIGRYYSRSFIDYISQRNQLIFIWKNITSSRMLSSHRLYLIRNLLKGKLWRPFVSATLKLPIIFEKRKIEKANSVISDEEIFHIFEES